jgi:hypothetical protein
VGELLQIEDMAQVSTLDDLVAGGQRPTAGSSSPSTTCPEPRDDVRHGSIAFQGFTAHVGAPPTISDTEVVDTPNARISHQMCGFVPLRNGIADDPRRRIPLTADKAVKLQLNQEHAINRPS